MPSCTLQSLTLLRVRLIDVITLHTELGRYLPSTVGHTLDSDGRDFQVNIADVGVLLAFDLNVSHVILKLLNSIDLH